MAMRLARLAVVAPALVVAAVLGPADPAPAQEWRIYLLGKTEPIVANFYTEDTPWVYYRDDQSMYLFALGCNRIERVERGGTPLPPLNCPVEKLPTTMPAIFAQVMDLEAKRLDDNINKLREQTRAYAQAVVGSFAASGELVGRPTVPGEAELIRRRSLDAISFLQSQINDTLFDIRLSEQRVGALADAAKTFPRGEKQRYFFFMR
jgi:hypothetical protein